MTEVPDIFPCRKEIIASAQLGSLYRVDIEFNCNPVEQRHRKETVNFLQPTSCEEADRFTLQVHHEYLGVYFQELGETIMSHFQA